MTLTYIIDIGIKDWHQHVYKNIKIEYKDTYKLMIKLQKKKENINEYSITWCSIFVISLM
jgi:hypothetical protein